MPLSLTLRAGVSKVLMVLLLTAIVIGAEHLAALRRERPGMRFRLVRRIWAICTACGARYGFNAHLRAFGLVP
jgi:hypothetical protein